MKSLNEERDEEDRAKLDSVPKDFISCTSDPYTRWNSENLNNSESDQF